MGWLAEGMGLLSNLLHLSICFEMHYFLMVQPPAMGCLSPTMCFCAARSTSCCTIASGHHEPQQSTETAGLGLGPVLRLEADDFFLPLPGKAEHPPDYAGAGR